MINASGADIADGVATVTITDNDSGGTPATLSSSSVSANESAGQATLTVTLSQPVDATVRAYTRAGTASGGGDDFFGFTRSISFTGGNTEQQIVVTLTDAKAVLIVR